MKPWWTGFSIMGPVPTPVDLTPTSTVIYTSSLRIVHKLSQRGTSVHHGQLIHWAAMRQKPDTLFLVQFLVSVNNFGILTNYLVRPIRGCQESLRVDNKLLVH